MLIAKISQSSDFIVGISLLVVGLLTAAILSFYLYKHRSSQKYNSELKIARNSSKDYFSFLKKNFSIFIILFFVVMSITGLGMVITSLT